MKFTSQEKTKCDCKSNEKKMKESKQYKFDVLHCFFTLSFWGNDGEIKLKTTEEILPYLDEDRNIICPDGYDECEVEEDFSIVVGSIELIHVIDRIKEIVDNNKGKYKNISLDHEYEYGLWSQPKIIGKRLETDEEFKQRLEMREKRKKQKLQAKADRIKKRKEKERAQLEKLLAKREAGEI